MCMLMFCARSMARSYRVRSGVIYVFGSFCRNVQLQAILQAGFFVCVGIPNAHLVISGPHIKVVPACLCTRRLTPARATMGCRVPATTPYALQ
jgi:hypothetical protein